MTYSIIPPIVVVLSLIGIILFLMKKVSRVRQLSEDAPRQRGLDVFSPAGNAEPSGSKMRSVKRGLFLTLEKMTSKLKIMFLKLGNKFTSWNESVRQRRKKHANELAPKTEEGNEIFSGGSIRPEESNRKFGKREVFVRETLEERMRRPMISDRVVVPQAKDPEIKDRLEKLLIERIAVNPKDTEAYERLGEYYFEIRNYNYAKECFKQVIKLNPGNIDAKNRMKRLEKILMR
jgi:hypothetical protein